MKFTISWLKEHLDTQKKDNELITHWGHVMPPSFKHDHNGRPHFVILTH